MLRFVFYLSIIFALNSIFAQTNRLSFQGGLAISNFNSSLLQGSDFKKGEYLSISFEHLTSKKLLFSSGLEYCSMGSNIVGIYLFNDELLNYDRSIELNYLSIPLKLGRQIGDEYFGFGYFGVSNRILMSASSLDPVITSDGEITSYIKSDISNKPKRFDLAGFINLGFGKKIFTRHLVFLSVNISHSFFTFSNDDFLTGLNTRNYGGSFCLGYSYNLSK